MKDIIITSLKEGDYFYTEYQNDKSTLVLFRKVDDGFYYEKRKKGAVKMFLMVMAVKEDGKLSKLNNIMMKEFEFFEKQIVYLLDSEEMDLIALHL